VASRSAGGAAESSPRRQPWVNRPVEIQVPEGAAENNRPTQLSPLPGLNASANPNPLKPWAIIVRCSAASQPPYRLGESVLAANWRFLTTFGCKKGKNGIF